MSDSFVSTFNSKVPWMKALSDPFSQYGAPKSSFRLQINKETTATEICSYLDHPDSATDDVDNQCDQTDQKNQNGDIFTLVFISNENNEDNEIALWMHIFHDRIKFHVSNDACYFIDESKICVTIMSYFWFDNNNIKGFSLIKHLRQKKQLIQMMLNTILYRIQHVQDIWSRMLPYDCDDNLAVFTNEIERKEIIQNYICIICHKVLFDPVEFPCHGSHLFCRLCILAYKYNQSYEIFMKSNQKLACPSCKEVIECTNMESIQSNGYVKRKLQSFTFSCVNKNLGCPVTLNLGVDNRNIIQHLTTECQYGSYVCSECNLSIECSSRNQHEEICIYFCELCERYFPVSAKKSHLTNIKFPDLCVNLTYCPKNCKTVDGHIAKILIDQLEKHFETECKESLLNCPVETCSSYKRKDRIKHINKDVASHVAYLFEQEERKTLQYSSKKRRAEIQLDHPLILANLATSLPEQRSESNSNNNMV